ncbi:hypothetical protein BC6307_08030 [Sutcliffiella cohnii]|uniref:DUF4871 domain-containing protein n=1 Tax=Sutcliffiella cohnii TaxID=33932 RepID=A0A223KP49_9BACI|nr:hypothetical protein [Sutcliffiella cohnii]AST91229.1 hypothetical protein BC6307_08030 [Sutcliffiella cohnii]
MENELKNLRKAMNSSTHKGVHFTELQKKKIRASLHQREVTKKPNFSIYLITTLAVSLFILLFYTGFLPNFYSSDDINRGSLQPVESEWKVRHEYTKNNQKLFEVFPDPTLSAGKTYGYIFSFKESFDIYKGKDIEIYAIHSDTGERINVLPSKTITEPSGGYSSLQRFTAFFEVPDSGLWKYEVYFNNKLYGDVVLSVGDKVIQNIDIPSFVKASDIEIIDWNRKAVNIGNNIVGNKNKSGVIGANMPSININQKWMWHLWEIENPTETKLTAIGFHRETETWHQIITTGWTIGLGGANNGADAHAPSSVNIPMPGEWSILLYVDGELFDVLVYNINE